jgi:predicted 3-demethylubiquinone-9 3-methyltransferase (glyoxalase superfamily)
MKGITTFLMFNNNAEEAIRFYISVIPNSRIVTLKLMEEDGQPIRKGKVFQAHFQLNGVSYFATDGGPEFTFSMGTSLYIHCENQAEIDRLSAGLIQGGGQQLDCGWVVDRFGLSWQIVPTMLDDILLGNDAPTAKRVFEAMLTMKKLDIAQLERAAREPAHA